MHNARKTRSRTSAIPLCEATHRTAGVHARGYEPNLTTDYQTLYSTDFDLMAKPKNECLSAFILAI